MICANTHIRLRIAAALGSAALAICAGCTSSSAPQAQAFAVGTASQPDALVFSSAPVRNWHASNTNQPGVGLIAADRYEYSRNDPRLTPGSRSPLIATRQWPQPPQPLERPIYFRRWQQR